MKESSLKVATTRAELHKTQHKSIQVAAEGIGLKNYLIRNVAALHDFQCNNCPRKIQPRSQGFSLKNGWALGTRLRKIKTLRRHRTL